MTKTHKAIRNQRLNQLALTTALSGMSIFGYARGVYAGRCPVTGTPGTYLCSGGAVSATDPTQALTGTPLEVVLDPGFAIDTSTTGGDAFSLTGTNGLNFDDQGGPSLIIGSRNGISATNVNTAASADNTLAITTSGTIVRGLGGDGIYVSNSGALNGMSNRLDVAITTGSVSGLGTGIHVGSTATALRGINVTVDTTDGTVTGTNAQGIDIGHSGQAFMGSGRINVTTADISSGLTGIEVESAVRTTFGSDITVDSSSGGISAVGGYGIHVTNDSAAYGGTSHVSITSGAIAAGHYGIRVNNRGDGRYGSTVTLDTAAGLVLSVYETGIHATNMGKSMSGASDLSITTADVGGFSDGIYALNLNANQITDPPPPAAVSGSNSLSINTTRGRVQGFSGRGIYANNEGASGTGASNLSITTGTVAGDTHGIYATNNGVAATNSDLTIDSTQGYVAAFRVSEFFDGGYAVYAVNNGDADGTSDLSITTANVSGAYAIQVTNNGAGALGSNLTVNTSAGTITANSGRGIYAVNNGRSIDVDDFGLYFGGAANLSITTADVIAGDNGIDARNYGTAYDSSTLSIDTTAGRITSVPGSAATGIYAHNAGDSKYGSSDLAITTGDISADSFGISALNDSSGGLGANLTINTTAGSVWVDPEAPQGRDGISVVNLGSSVIGTSDLSITTADVTGARNGIQAQNFSEGFGNAEGFAGASISINTRAGSVVGTVGHGIYAGHRGVSEDGDADLTIITANVTGGRYGISAIALADGDASASVFIDTMAGTVIGQGEDGIQAINESVSEYGATDLIITTAAVTGAEFGIFARNEEDGYLGSDLLIDTRYGAVVGQNRDGINAKNRGDAVEGIDGVTVTTDLVITADRVTGHEDGIYVRNYADGFDGSDLIIGSSGLVTGESNNGIDAANYGYSDFGTTNLTVFTRDVTGEQHGIIARNAADGLSGSTLIVNSRYGAVTGNLRDGIDATNSSNSDYGSSDLRITTANVSGAENGIRARNNGIAWAGASTIINTVSGSVEGNTLDGIYADLQSSAFLGNADLRITTAAVSGENSGVFARNNSSGSDGSSLIMDTIGGTVQGMTGAGIFAAHTGFSSGGRADLSVTTATVTGATIGIEVRGDAGGYSGSDVTIDSAAGSVTGVDGTGIFALNENVAADGTSNLVITTATVEGALGGIVARNDGLSAAGSNLTIDTTAGLVDGAAGTGIYAANSGSAVAGTTDLTLTVGNVVSLTDAVSAVQNSDGDLIFRSANSVAGGFFGYGLIAVTNGMGATDIALANSGLFGGSAGISADHGSSTGAFTIDVGRRAVIGNVSGLSSDLAIRARSEGTGLTLTNQAGGVLVGTLDLTAQDDVVNNAGTWRTAGGVNDFGGGNDVVNNTSLQTLVVGSGAPNQVTFMNNLELFNNSGRVTFVDGFAGDTLVLSGNFDGTGGVMAMEFDATTRTTDLLVVNGDVVGGPTTVVLTGIGGAGGLTGTGQNDGISLVQVAGTTSAADFQLVGAAQVDVFLYGALSLGSDNVWRVQSAFLPSINGYEVYPSALLNMTKLAPYRDRRAPQVRMGQNGTEAWLQMGGTWLERDQEASISGTSFEQNFNEITAGVDFATQGAITLGVNLRFSEGSTLINGPSGPSTITTEGYGIGGSLTWQGPDGVYVDAQARYMSFISDLPGRANHGGQGIAASFEVGRSLALPSDGWSMTQRAQLSYSVVDFDDIEGGFGETVRLRDGESLTGRFGLALNRDWSAPDGGADSLFGALDLVHEVMPDTAVDVTVLNTTTFARSAAPTRIEFGLGGTIGLSETSHLYGALNASQNLGGGDSPQLNANLGFIMRW